MLRRTRSEVGRELPPINKIVLPVDFDEGEIKKSEDLAKQLAMQVLNRDATFTERGEAAMQFNLLYRKITGLSKARSVAMYVKMLLDAGERLVLAGWHREVYEIWLHELRDYNPVMYTGTDSPVQKNKSLQAFKDGETNIFIISLRSGAGIDGLQYVCNTIVHGELDWSPKIHDQLNGRVDRDGAPKQVTAIYPVTDYGSDPPMMNLLGLKASQAHGIVDPNTDPLQQHTDEGRIKALAQQFLDKLHKKLV